MATKLKLWKCICGREYEITSKPIQCVGKGHSVYISPSYWNYKLKEKQYQLTLL